MPESREKLRGLRDGLREQIRALIDSQGFDGARQTIAHLLTIEERQAHQQQPLILHTRDIDGQRYVRLEDTMEAIAQAASRPIATEEDQPSLGEPATCGGCGSRIWKILDEWHGLAGSHGDATRCPGDGDTAGHHWPIADRYISICSGCNKQIVEIEGRWIRIGGSDALAPSAAADRCPAGGVLGRGGKHEPARRP